MSLDERIIKHLGSLVLENARLAHLLDEANAKIEALQKVIAERPSSPVERLPKPNGEVTGHANGNKSPSE